MGHSTSSRQRPTPSGAPSTWGGARPGAGRKKTSPFVSHLKRPRLEGRKFPALITLRLRSGLPSFRDPEVFSVFHKATLRARRFGLRVIDYRVEAKSLKLLCEFHTAQQMEKSFKSLNTALAIILKKSYFKKNGTPHAGPIFLGRFMMEEVNDPRRLQSVLRELLLEDPDAAKAEPISGAFSSAAVFAHWRDLLSDGRRLKPPFVLKSGKSLAAQLTHVDEQKIIREITASPQFAFTKTALRSLS